MDKVFENNQVTIAGTIASDFRFSHEVYGEKFYVANVAVVRLSGTSDYIPITMPEHACEVNGLHVGQRVVVVGQLRSFNRHVDERIRLELSVFAREVEILDDLQSGREENELFMAGYICKEPVYRKTPLGREIADILLAVNRAYGKTDYIPCIAWGRNARFVSGFEVGDYVKICGRIQSREYTKKLSETESEQRTAYEVSISKIELVEENADD